MAFASHRRETETIRCHLDGVGDVERVRPPAHSLLKGGGAILLEAHAVTV